MVSTSGARIFEPIYKEGHAFQNCVQDYFFLEGISRGRQFKEIRKDDKLVYEVLAESASSTTAFAYLRTALKIASWFTVVVPLAMVILHSFITPSYKASVPIVPAASKPQSPKKIDPLPSPKQVAVSPPAGTVGELPGQEPDVVVDRATSFESTVDEEESFAEEKVAPGTPSALDPQFFASPALITFTPSPEHLKQFQSHYKLLKARLENKAGVNITFDDQNKSITFKHAENEVKAILTSESLSHYLPQFFTLTRGSLVRVGADRFELRRSTDFKGKKAVLIKKAQAFFNAQKGNFVSVDPTLKPGNLLGSLLKSNQGICFGELSNEKSSRRFLFDTMQQLKKLGVKTLFLEFLCYDTAQKWLDDYFSSPLDKPMHPYLAQYLRELDAGNRKDGALSYANLVIAAKNAGIRVVALDTTVSTLAGYTDRTGTNDVRERLMAMNYTAVEIIRKEAGIDKYVALMGSQHVGDNEKVPGVANVLQIPSVVVTDTIGNAKASLKANVANFRNRVKKIGAHLQYPKSVSAKPAQQKNGPKKAIQQHGNLPRRMGLFH